MPYAGGPVPGALPFAPRPSAGNHTAVIVLVVVVAAAALVGGLVVVVRDVAAKRDAHALSPSPSDDRTGKDDKADHRPDPWAGSSPLDGDKLAVGQGVSLIVPSGFRTTVQNGFTGAYDARGVAIMAGPIAIATDDPMQLAKFHARSNNLVFESMDHVFIGGVQRPMAIFHGTVAGTPVRHVAVALIGPGYRIAVMFQAPAALATSDPAVQALAFELYTRRVILP
jgi:hypothetical protein